VLATADNNYSVIRWTAPPTKMKIINNFVSFVVSDVECEM